MYYYDKNLAPAFVGFTKFTCKTLDIDDWIPLLEKKKKEGAFKKITKTVRGSQKEAKTKGLLHIKSEMKSYAGVIKVIFLAGQTNLVQYLRTPNLFLFKAMVGTETKHQDDVYTAIMLYLWQHGQVAEYMQDILKTEISATCMSASYLISKQALVARQQLFRTDSQATKLIMNFIKKVGQGWFCSVTCMYQCGLSVNSFQPN